MVWAASWGWKTNISISWRFRYCVRSLTGGFVIFKVSASLLNSCWVGRCLPLRTTKCKPVNRQSVLRRQNVLSLMWPSVLPILWATWATESPRENSNRIKNYPKYQGKLVTSGPHCVVKRSALNIGWRHGERTRKGCAPMERKIPGLYKGSQSVTPKAGARIISITILLIICISTQVPVRNLEQGTTLVQ